MKRTLTATGKGLDLTSGTNQSYDTPKERESGVLSMRGKVKTKQKCSVCHGTFEVVTIRKGPRVYLDMRCPICSQPPTGFYISIYFDKEIAHDLSRDKRKQKLYRDENGHLFTSYDQAHRFLENLNRSIDKGEFNVNHYLSKEVDAFRGRTLFYNWLKSTNPKADPKADPEDYILTERCRYVKYYFAGIKDDQGNFIHQGFFYDKDLRKCRAGTLDDFKAWIPKAQDELKKFVPEKDRKRKFNPLSEKTIKNIFIELRVFFTWLYRREDIDKIPVFPKIEPPDPIIHCTTKSNQEKVLDALKPHHRPIFELMVDLPVRPGEARALKAKYFDLDIWTVHIAEAFSKKTVKHRKGKHDYILPLSYRFDPQILEGKGPDDWVFLNECGRPYKSENIRRIWHRACKRAGVPRIKMYEGTRKTTLTTALIKTNGNYDKVSKLAGHSTPEMIRKHYAKWNVEMLRDLVSDPADQPQNLVPLKHPGHQRGTKKLASNEN